jgi:hypothetical protein
MNANAGVDCMYCSAEAKLEKCLGLNFCFAPNGDIRKGLPHKPRCGFLQVGAQLEIQNFRTVRKRESRSRPA